MSQSTRLSAEGAPKFHNEPFTDFGLPANAEAMKAALAGVKASFGREYDLLIAGARLKTGDKLVSVNPSNPSEAVGIHHKATAELARSAVESAFSYVPEWSRRPVAERTAVLRKAAGIIRARKLEFDAWLVYEAGKTWIEAEADVCEAIDFCEYYANEMDRLAGYHPMSHMPGEKDELIYLPLGVGVIIAPWNFPLAILTGMTTAALVAGNTVVMKPSSDTPAIAAKLAEVLLEAGFPPKAFSLVTGSGAAVGDELVAHPKTRFVCFTGSREVGLHINELAAKTQPGQIWIKRVIAEMGGKDAIIVDEEADLDAAVAGVLASAFGYQGQKCSACSRAIVAEPVYEKFLESLRAKTDALTVGPADDPRNYMGPVISEKALKTILSYVELGKSEGRLISGGGTTPGDGYFLRPTIIADVEPKARIFQEEIFGPVLAVTKARDFENALELANDSEYGLTGAVFTRNHEKIEAAKNQFFVGNLYINRKCTGAMVAAHPFGGFNMSGTDSKAGGPDYMQLFLQAKSIGEKVS